MITTIENNLQKQPLYAPSVAFVERFHCMRMCCFCFKYKNKVSQYDHAFCLPTSFVDDHPNLSQVLLQLETRCSQL